MKRGLVVLTSAVLLAACASAGPTLPSPSPSPSATVSPSPSASASALPAGPVGYVAVWSGYPALRLDLVDGHGTVVATVTPWSPHRTLFRDPPQGTGPGTADADLMPYFSSSRTRLYYLASDTQVRYLGVDGSSGLAKTLSVGSLQHAGFAVSPDDHTIAVSLIDYSVTPHRITVYTEDLAGSGRHRVLYTSTTRFAWPIAFKGDQVLMAVGPTGSQSGSGDPYFAAYGYALLDGSGNVVRRFCAPATNAPGDYGTARGPVDPDGAICDSPSGRVLQTWSGTRVPLSDNACGSDQVVEYAPDRRHILCTEVTQNATLTLRVVDPSGHMVLTHSANAGAGSDTRFYWVDDTHVVIGADLVDISTGAAVPLAQPATVMWGVPGDVYLGS